MTKNEKHYFLAKLQHNDVKSAGVDSSSQSSYKRGEKLLLSSKASSCHL